MPSLYHLTKVFYLPNHVVQENLTVGHAEPVPPNHGVLLTNSCSAVLNTWLSDMPSLYHLTKVFYLPNHVVQEYLTVGHAEPVHLTKVFYLPIHVVQEYLTVGHAEPVPPNQGVYLQIHVVQKGLSIITKVRAVFDASSKTLTVNNTLMVTPAVHHQCAHPLPSAQVYHHGNEEKSQLIVFRNPTNSNRSFYVDDCLTGADDVPSTIQLQEQLQSLLANGGFVLPKWNSSEPLVLYSIPDDLRESITS